MVKNVRILKRKVFIHVFIHPVVASECFQSGPLFSVLANYLLNYAQLIFLDCLTGPIFALQARKAEIYKYDTATFAAKSAYKTEKGDDIWGHEVDVNLTYHTDGSSEATQNPKTMAPPVSFPVQVDKTSLTAKTKETDNSKQTAVQKGKIKVIREEDYDEEVIKGVTNSRR